MDSAGEFAEEFDGGVGDAFARAWFRVTVEAGPDLVTTEFVAFAIGQVADPVIGEFGDVGVAERRTIFDVEAELGEVLGGHTDECDVADAQGLDPCFALLALLGGECGAHVAEDACDGFGVTGRVAATVAVDGGGFGGFIEGAHAEFQCALDGSQTMDGLGLGLGDGEADGGSDAAGAFVTAEREIMVGAGCAFEEGEDAAEIGFKILGGETVEGRGPDTRFAGADAVGAVIEEDGLEFVADGVAEGENGQFRIERAGGPDEVGTGTDPVDLAVVEEDPAVLAHRRFLGELEVEA